LEPRRNTVGCSRGNEDPVTLDTPIRHASPPPGTTRLVLQDPYIGPRNRQVRQPSRTGFGTYSRSSPSRDRYRAAG
jgi:hypothetical protein